MWFCLLFCFNVPIHAFCMNRFMFLLDLAMDVVNSVNPIIVDLESRSTDLAMDGVDCLWIWSLSIGTPYKC
jgi:hypothetical protein